MDAKYKGFTVFWAWMIDKKLKINDDKTFLTIIPSKTRFSANLQLKIGQEIVLPSTSCKSRGVMFDNHMLNGCSYQSYLLNHTIFTFAMLEQFVILQFLQLNN